MQSFWMLVQPFVIAFLAVGWVIMLTRLNGLRSFSKFSAFDFAITVATGSALASTIMDPTIGKWGALAALFVTQATISVARVRSDLFERWVDNTPLLLMRDREVLDDNLHAAKMTRTDLIAKLRESGVTNLDDVRAVVFETAGTVSVLSGDTLDEEMLQDVRRHRDDETKRNSRVLDGKSEP